MDAADIVVIALGAGAIFWVNWYFFLSQRGAPAAAVPAGNGAAEITIVVDGGYSPNAVRVRSGEKTRIVFDRRDNSSCSEEVVFPDFGIRKFLPTGERTAIDVTPPAPGRYEFMCGMSMLRGTLVAD